MTSAKPFPTLFLAIALAVVVHVGSAGWNIFFGPTNTDEGFYAIATRSVAHGEMPYRDFGFTQTPGVLYANSLPLKLVGFGLFPQRIVNGLWAAAALGLAAIWLGRRTHALWGIALTLLFSLSVPWMYFIHLGKTYGFATLLTTLAAWTFLDLKNGPRRNLILGTLVTAGTATRLPAAPFFGVLWLLTFWPGRRPTQQEVIASIGSASLSFGVVALPFVLWAPVATKFWIYDFHLVSVPMRDWTVPPREQFVLAPVCWLLALFAILVAARRRRWPTREMGVLVAALLTLELNLIPRGAYEEYGVPFLLPLTMAAGAILFDEIRERPRSWTYALVTLLIGAHFAAVPLLFPQRPAARRFSPSTWLPIHTPNYNMALPNQVATARQIVAESLAPTAPFVGTNIILAAETGRFVPPELRMGPFSFTLEMTAERAALLHLATHEQIDAWFARPDVTVLAFFRRPVLNYGWTMPSFASLREDFHSLWFAPIHRDFKTVYDTDFAVLLKK